VTTIAWRLAHIGHCFHHRWQAHFGDRSDFGHDVPADLVAWVDEGYRLWSTSVLAAGIMLNVGAIALWALSRTSGAPFGPHAGEPELVRAADLCALLLQIYLVMAAGWVVYRGHHGEPIPAFGNAIVLLGATAVVALASTVGVASGLQHGHPEQAGAATDHHGPAAGPSEAHHGVQADPLPAAPAPTEPALQSDEPLNDDHADHPHHE